MTNYLKEIKTPSDLRRLDIEKLDELAAEIRELIMTTVSRTGGHLASNLGVVELTIALHYVFDFSHDRLTWDVGHQCYPHKILTGRADRFHTLRQGGGISGFPSPAESDYDPFFAGHAGTAIASAVGLALGAQFRGGDEKVVAVVGDGSIVNGLSFEALNNTSLVKRQLLIILNDNSMAIDKTAGAFANYLTHLRVVRPYDELEKRTRMLVQKMPLGDAIHDTLHRLKGGLKTTLLGPGRFEQLRIPLFGPIDGHNTQALIRILTMLRQVDHPVILHVQTQKGRGFTPAHEDPCTFHSPVPFQRNGQSASFEKKIDRSFTACFSAALGRQMQSDKRIVAITAAMPDGTGLAELRGQFADRIIDVGIAESAAVTIAAGLAKQKFKPVVAVYSTFLQRAFDQIFHDVCLQNLPVVFCLDRGGMVGGDGAVHHGFCDVAFLRPLPNIVLMAPMDEWEMTGALELAMTLNQPCAIRYPRDHVPEPASRPTSSAEPFELGKAAVLRRGSCGAILAYGSGASEALHAADELSREGVELTVVSARFAKPLDDSLLSEILTQFADRPIITLEDHARIGGFGSAVLEFAHERRLDARRVIRLGIPDQYIPHDSRKAQLACLGLDARGLIQAVRDALK
jgi:1-deoxy-D-xylulose-5-phosphate synthase